MSYKLVTDDPRYHICEAAEKDPKYLDILEMLDKGRISEAKGLNYLNADGIYYHDTRTPFISTDETAVTLAATDKLVAPGARTALPANYFTVGKRLRLTYFGRFTTAATPGNIGVELYYGTTDAGGTLLASSGAVALTLNKTSISWYARAYCQCRAIGATGSLLAWGEFATDPAGALLTNNGLLVPATAPAAVTVDTTAAQGFNVQVKRSGSTVETLQVHDIIFESLN